MQPRSPEPASIPAALAAAGVQVLTLRGGAIRESLDEDPAVAGMSDAADRTMQLLVPKSQIDAALRVIEPLGWRYSWVRAGLLRLVPMRYYWWDGGSEVELYWGLPAAPLPSSALGRLTRAVRESAASTGQATHRPGAAELLVHLAVQACRPGRSHEDDWTAFGAARTSIVDLAEADAVARRAGVSRALRTALDAADAGQARPERGAAFDGLAGVAWRLACAVQARARPRRLKRLLAGSPWFGDAAIRCRVGPIEVISGPGVFVPSPDADLFAEDAGVRIAQSTAPTVVEVGTGCGAIALALAHARPDARIHATELSPVAVRWAKRNARRLGLEGVRFAVGSLLDSLPSTLHGRVDLIIANLPYFPAREYMAIGSVPRGTIQGAGDDGLGLIRQLARDAIPYLVPGGGLLLQMFDWQWEVFSGELAGLGYRPGAPRRIGAFVIAPADLAADPGRSAG